MKYLSTRGQAPQLGFEDALLEGLARDGGLYVPSAWPTLSPDEWSDLRGRHYADLAVRVMWPFVQDAIERDAFERIVCEAYSKFRHQAVAPLVQIAPSLWVMELFHGPTLAFKDVAMQVLGGLFDHVLAKRDERLTIVGATSGDTGGAAIEAIAGRDRADIFILHPKGRTSDVQRKQMTTVHADNVHNLAVHGTFDDCQALVKAMFNDGPFRDRLHLSGVNSINWARVMPQAGYYVAAAAQLGALSGGPAPKFSVPTGNFGDIYAGYIAHKMGLPIGRLIVASNSNDILTRVFNTGDHTLGDVHATTSPSMDIQVSSNFERLLYDVLDQDALRVAELMAKLKSDRTFKLDADAVAKLAEHFSAYRATEPEVHATMKTVYERTSYLLDPHTAVGVHAAEQEMLKTGDRATPMVVLATAHPAKFPDAVEAATGVRPPLPDFLADLYEREERYDEVADDLAAVEAMIEGRAAVASNPR
ncbi:MAG: threonine synthase [Planctomycetota bacterium]